MIISQILSIVATRKHNNNNIKSKKNQYFVLVTLNSIFKIKYFILRLLLFIRCDVNSGDVLKF